jgi:hypothetical protein
MLLLFNQYECIIDNISVVRSNLRQEQTSLQRKSSLTKRTKILERRRRLLLKITAFNHKAEQFMGDLDFDEVPLANNAVGQDDPAEDDIDSDDEGPSSTEDEDGVNHANEIPDNDDNDEQVEFAENLALVMPSTLSAEHCLHLGLGILMEQEIKLREGQANDALEQLRTALAVKSLLYRTTIRHRPSNKTSTRSWSAINRADAKIRKHLKTYNLARTALLNMDANVDEFKAIVKEDLKMSADVVEENRIGQRSDTMAWFWKIGPQRDDREGTWMQECKCHL